MKNKNNIEAKITRSGLKDVWNAFMLEDATFSQHDIPYCPTTASKVPTSIITFTDAKSIYKKMLRKDKDFFYDSFVCFYEDDYKFDGERGIWNRPNQVLKILRHFAGAITPDFSTYQDFPKPLKLYNTYRMRAFGYWLSKNGIAIINNIRWGTSESWEYCFDGLPMNSIYAIGSVGGSPHKLKDRERFENGLTEMVKRLKPKTIIVYGSANYPCFAKLIEQGINIISYQSHTALAFERRKCL